MLFPALFEEGAESAGELGGREGSRQGHRGLKVAPIWSFWPSCLLVCTQESAVKGPGGWSLRTPREIPMGLLASAFHVAQRWLRWHLGSEPSDERSLSLIFPFKYMKQPRAARTSQAPSPDPWLPRRAPGSHHGQGADPHDAQGPGTLPPAPLWQLPGRPYFPLGPWDRSNHFPVSGLHAPCGIFLPPAGTPGVTESSSFGHAQACE